MATTNPVFQVLVTKGNLALLAASKKPEELAPGQMGVFDFHTNLSVDGTSIPTSREVYLAVGVDRDGDSVTDDIVTSAGQMIQKENMRNYNVKCYSAAQSKVVELTGFKAKCETEYGLKIELKNQLGYRLHGTNQIAKTFLIKTSCCGDSCDTCPEGECNEIASKLTKEINSDSEKILKAEMIDSSGTVVTDASTSTKMIVSVGSIVGGSGYTNGTYTAINLLGGTGTGAKATIEVASGAVTTVTITSRGSGYTEGDVLSATLGSGTGFTAVVTEVESECLGIRITANPLAIKKFCSVNLGYFNPRGTDITVSAIAGFECNGVLTETQGLKFEEGLGYDIAQLEYEAGGWNGKPGPYRVSTLAGMPVESFESYVNQTAKYLQLNLIYDQFSVAGWGEHLNNLNTIVAVPCADTTTRSSLFTILDRIYSNFGPLADDVSLCDCDGTDTVADIDDTTKDGIG